MELVSIVRSTVTNASTLLIVPTVPQVSTSRQVVVSYLRSALHRS